jgi:hypothetical protein
MIKQDFTLFFSLPLSEKDWANLSTSRVSRVMLPLGLADQATLGRLAAQNIRVVLRVEEGRYGNDIGRQQVKNQVVAAGGIAKVSAVIVGCEPEGAVSFEYGAASWGQDVAYAHMRDLGLMTQLLKHAGFVVVSPGWRMRSISEDDQPQPGEATWSEITRLQYDACDGNACHLYTYNWTGIVDELRVKFALQRFAWGRHKLMWLDEVGVNSGTPIERMRAYIDIAQMLLSGPVGRRVTMLCPFVCNGNPGIPPSWSPGYVLSDPQCYVELGAWLGA